MRARDFRAAAREALRGRWIKTVLLVFLAGCFGATASISDMGAYGDIQYGWDISALGVTEEEIARIFPVLAAGVIAVMLLTLFVGSWVRLGLTDLGIRVLDGERPRADVLFPRKLYWKSIGLKIMRSIFISWWGFLLIIPGIIAIYSYSMADYLLCTHPEMGVFEALRESRRRMRGHKGRLFCLELSFYGWALLAFLPAAVTTLQASSPSLWMVIAAGTIVTAAAEMCVQTYMHVANMAFFRDVDRAGVWREEARAGEEEFRQAQHRTQEDFDAREESFEGAYTRPEEAVSAKELFMQYGCSRARLREAGRLEEYERMGADSFEEQGWIRDYARALMLRFNRDALALDGLLTLAGEYVMDDLVSRVLERIERHLRQETLPMDEILNMVGRVLALLVSGAFAGSEGFVRRKQDQILDMALRLEHRLEQEQPDGGWQDALKLIRQMCAD